LGAVGYLSAAHLVERRRKIAG